jgi:hypothetical protein
MLGRCLGYWDFFSPSPPYSLGSALCQGMPTGLRVIPYGEVDVAIMGALLRSDRPNLTTSTWHACTLWWWGAAGRASMWAPNGPWPRGEGGGWSCYSMVCSFREASTMTYTSSLPPSLSLSCGLLLAGKLGRLVTLYSRVWAGSRCPPKEKHWYGWSPGTQLLRLGLNF